MVIVLEPQNALIDSERAEYRTTDNRQRTMDVVTNAFCAVRCPFIFNPISGISDNIQGGNVLANGTWVNVGGNQAVTVAGAPADSQDGSSAPYYDADGRKS